MKFYSVKMMTIGDCKTLKRWEDLPEIEMQAEHIEHLTEMLRYYMRIDRYAKGINSSERVVEFRVDGAYGNGIYIMDTFPLPQKGGLN